MDLLTLAEISERAGISQERLEALDAIQPVVISKWYANLINWSDPADPLRRIVMPSVEELVPNGRLDPSDEARYTRATGLQHKYGPTALILTSRWCASQCRYCFRKRIFNPISEEAPAILSEAVAYLQAHPEIREVILSGGDPLGLSTTAISRVIEALSQVSTIATLRIHTKLLAFDPARVLNDPALLTCIASATTRFRVFIGAHFDHSREITGLAIQAIAQFRKLGVEVLVQCPLLHGVNDSTEALVDLWRSAHSSGCAPHYLFQCRPVAGAARFAVPIKTGIRLIAAADSILTSLERRATYVMALPRGKFEILGAQGDAVFLRQLSCAIGQTPIDGIVTVRANDDMCWIEDESL
jgi:lysine 2,3-aminomutase